ncbi:hypothetical protein HY251_01670 [bacterium]|nr:hypothetical protein [bacterium]
MFHCIVCGSRMNAPTHLYRTVAVCGWRCVQRFNRDPLVFLPVELDLIEY